MDQVQGIHTHPVFYEETGQSHLENFLDFHSGPNSRIFILGDQNTLLHCLPLLQEKITTSRKLDIIEMPAGEKNKNLETCRRVWQDLTLGYADRSTILINLGGGVVCDLGGFAASVYKRGIRFIHFPTSLMAMCDAAIGGKTGIDLNSLKNIIGTFSQPLAVFIEPQFLKTLPARELKNGFAEMLKHGLVAEESYLDQLVVAGPHKITAEQIRLSVEIKSDIVIRDPMEKNIRKVLNFGHTIGHAIESFSLENDTDPLLHGEAVMLGMVAEILLSGKIQLMPGAEAERIIRMLKPYLPEYRLDPEDIEAIIPLLLHDKKNRDIRPAFTLLRRPGLAAIDQFCQPEAIHSCLVEAASVFK